MRCRYNLHIMILYVIILFFIGSGKTTNYDQLYDRLKVNFAGEAKIEVGGPFVGVEFHHSSPVPQRISFFYPVANSIDISTDYWHRDTTYIMAIGLKMGNNKKEWLGKKPFAYTLTPYNVTFNNEDKEKAIEISYRFTKNQPAMVVTYKITNRSNTTQNVEFDTHLETSLRTSHSFTKKNEALAKYDPETSTIYINHAAPETNNSQIFVANAGIKPVNYNTSGPLERFLPPANDKWSSISQMNHQQTSSETAARFFYKLKLAHGETFTVVQVIGSAGPEEGYTIVPDIISNLQAEIDLFEQGILNETFDENLITLDDPDLTHSIYWAKAILASNKHYLDGEIVPMPCPAEYNFYFTHDVLVTDLAAVIFDLKRVKTDLDFIIRHANKNKVIPHAYYWKDSTYVTEYASSDNWNNFWMIITTASYLRHSADTLFVRSLYPYLEKCLEIAIQTKKEDHLMWSYRPDWWDIGKNYGPRSYMTILAIKAIRDYVYISAILKKNPNDLLDYELMGGLMQKALTDRLWHNDLNYLVNYYQDQSLDSHYYIGSLLAAHYNLLDDDRRKALVLSARQNLLDEKLGIYNAYPMDFHTLIDYLNFSGNEAGDTNYYFNGGIWPQGNAWYALALIADDSKREAYNFINNTMTLAGIMAGPNGQPAMYEVRNSNRSNPVPYGSIDKPQFMWAGAWYLYCLYHLFCIDEDDWNISFTPYLADNQNNYNFTLYAYGHPLEVKVEGSGTVIAKVIYDDEEYPSIVIPRELVSVREVKIYLGKPPRPYLKSSSSVLISSSFNESQKKLFIRLLAFAGHQNQTTLVSPWAVKSIRCDGVDITDDIRFQKKDSYTEISVASTHLNLVKEIEIEFL
jgi:hypothetical protein